MRKTWWDIFFIYFYFIGHFFFGTPCMLALTTRQAWADDRSKKNHKIFQKYVKVIEFHYCINSVFGINIGKFIQISTNMPGIKFSHSSNRLSFFIYYLFLEKTKTILHCKMAAWRIVMIILIAPIRQNKQIRLKHRFLVFRSRWNENEML